MRMTQKNLERLNRQQKENDVATSHKPMKVYTPNVELLPVEKLFVDHEYQRQLREARSKEISEQFDPRAVGYPAVSERSNGMFAIMDGQTRVAGMIAMGATHIHCEVFRGLSVKEEAHIFIKRNVSRGPAKAIEVFKARLVDRDPVAVEVLRLVTKHGFRIDFDSKRSKMRWPEFSCVGALEKAYLRWKILDQLLGLLKECLHETDDAMNEKLVLGLGRFLLYYENEPNFKMARLKSVLTPYRLRSIYRRTTDLVEVFHGTGHYNFARALLETYNAKLPRKTRLPRSKLFNDDLEEEGQEEATS